MTVYKVRLIENEEDLNDPDKGFTIEVDEDEFILDVAEDPELEVPFKLPFSCRAGTCSTCTGRVVEGDVKESGGDPAMFFNSGQRAAGFRLLCIGCPTSDCTILINQEPNISKF